jgi:prepilin-type processing-associated H-X9-DG protein
MPRAIICSCGHTLSPDDDWVGSTTYCPSCGAEIDLSKRTLKSWAARFCLVFGVLALVFYGATLADLPNRLQPRSISRIVEEVRTQNGYLASMAAALLALAAAYLSRQGGSPGRALGLLCGCVPLTLMPFQAANAVLQGIARESAPRAQCVNNLKQIGLALANYESRFEAFPPRVSWDREGKPLLSWRVAILPFIEQQELYDKFHLDEPWDSPHNLKLVNQIPATFICPGQARWTRNLTIYQVLDGPDAFLYDSKPTRLSEIADGTGNTIAVVEATIPVPWTSPQDVPFRTDQPFPAWEATHPGGFNASFVDGSVRFQKATMNEAELKASATRSGGEK